MPELILAVHLLVILFFVMGFPVGLVTNHRGFRYLHCAGLVGVTLLMLMGIPCPLTVLEESFRDSSYAGSFIATWLNRIIYMEWFNPRNVLLVDLCFMILVVSSFWWRPVKKSAR